MTQMKVSSDCFRILNFRETTDEKILEIGLVSSIVDSYETVIVPTGCLSPLESVPVDYNHNRISTGSTMVDLGIRQINIPDGLGGSVAVDVKIVEVHVPKTARMWTKENKDKKPEEVSSLYDNIENGRVAWGSIDFNPVKKDIEQIYDADGNLLRVIFKTWRLNFFSLLDTKPGQDTSYVLNIRSYINNQNKSTMKVGDKIKTNTERVIEFVDESGIRFFDDKKIYSVEEVRALTPEVSEKRAWVNDLMKNTAGEYGVVSKKITETDESGVTVSTVTIKKLDGTEVTVDNALCGWGNEDMAEGCEWCEASYGEVLMQILQMIAQDQVEDANEDATVAEGRALKAEGETEELKKEIETLKAQTVELEEIRKAKSDLESKYEVLLKSPDETSLKRDEDSAVDIGEGAEDTEKEVEEVDEEAVIEEQRMAILKGQK